MEKELYFAFISYKHADKDWAMWLQKSLQEYRLPTRTIKEHSGLPKRLSPIFIDQQYLRPGQLEEQLQEEVAASKFLIVVCSKAAHRESHYLDDEIHYFLNSGHSADHIIPFIIDPSNAPEKECFPLALQEVCKEHNLLGANVFENGKKRAFLKTVAYMLGIRLTELANAEDQRRRNHIIAAVCSALLCIGIVTGVGIYHYNYYIPHTAYYLDYAVHGGVPEGIHRLKKSEIAGMHSVVALTSCEGKVTTLRNEDSNGNLVEIYDEYQYVYDRPVMETYEYAGETLLKSTAYNRQGRVVYTKDYKNSSTIDFSRSTEEGYSSSIYMSSNTAGITSFSDDEDSAAKSSIVRYLVDYDADGYESEIRYVSNSNTNAIGANGDGIFGMRFVRDAKKRITEVQYLSCKDTKYATNKSRYYVSATKEGISGVRYEYNDLDQLAGVSFCDQNGSPILNEDGYASVQFLYNAENNGCQNNFCGTDGKLIMTDMGFAINKTEFDSRGYETVNSYYDENENPVLHKVGYAKSVKEYDGQGNVISCSFYGINGQPTLSNEHFAKLVKEYDEQGNVLSCSFYGTDGQPTLSNEQCAKWVHEYDSQGNVLSCSFYGTDGQPTLSNEQCAKWVHEYDSQGNVLSCSFYGTDGQPTLNYEHIAKWVSEYDERGNKISNTFYGTDGQPTLSNEQIAKWVSEYDERGNEVSCSFYGLDGQLTLSNEQCAKWVKEYDERGNVLSCSCYGIDGQPTLRDGGYAKWVSEFDAYGNELSCSFYGTDGQLILRKGGYAKWVSEFDERGNEISSAYYGTDGKLILRDEGYAKVIREYDDRGNKISCSFYGTDGQPILRDEGYAKWVSEFDDRGNEISSSYYGTDGQPILREGGYAKWVSEFDERGNEISCAYYGTDGKLILREGGYAKWVSEYDECGNEISCSVYGTDGQPILCEDGYAKRVSEYDARGNEISCSFYGTDGQPILREDGYAKWVSEYDDRGNEIFGSYYGLDGKLILRKYGYAEWSAEFDDRGNEISFSYYGTDGQLIPEKYGYAKIISEYDARGNEISYACYYTDKQLTLKDEYTTKDVKEYDEKNQVIHDIYYDNRDNTVYETFYDGDTTIHTILRDNKDDSVYESFYDSNIKIHTVLRDNKDNSVYESFYDSNGNKTGTKLVMPTDYGFKEIEKDEKGNVTSRVYCYGTAEQLILNEDGYAKRIEKYDEKENDVFCEYYGVDGQLILNKDGYAKREREYDENGKVISESYFGTDGQPILSTDGYAKIIRKYDKSGKEISNTFFGKDGQPVLCKAGYAKLLAEYSDDGKKITYTHYGIDGEPVLANGLDFKLVVDHDESGNKTYSASYDPQGNLIEETFYDSDDTYSWVTYFEVSDYVYDFKSLKVGDHIVYGHYPQTADGTDNKPIGWRVLEVRDGKALVISESGLDTQPYNTEQVPVTWETCSLRKWLNDDFLNRAFNKKEQAGILSTSIDNNGEEDKVFLLSKAEDDQYFRDDDEALAEATEYAIQRGVLKTTVGMEAWWLRTPDESSSAMTRASDGSSDNRDVNSQHVAVRPAFWLDLDPNETAEIVPISLSVKAGDHIAFGNYPQTAVGTDSTPIEWRVLDVQDGKALIISECGLDAQPYNKEYVPVTWETCTLRKWLNDDFLNKAFNGKEQAAILTTTVDNSKIQHDSVYYTDTCKDYPDTNDRIFLLSCREAGIYFGVNWENKNNLDSRVEPTRYAVRQGAYVEKNNKTSTGKSAGYWWLRSPGFDSCSSDNVCTDGSLNASVADRKDVVVRPVMWIDLSAFEGKNITDSEPTAAPSPTLAPTPTPTPAPTPTPTPTPEPTPTLHPADELMFSASVWSSDGSNLIKKYGNTVNLADLEEGQYYSPVLKISNDSGYTVTYNASAVVDGTSISWNTNDLSNNNYMNNYILKNDISNAAGEHTAVYSVDGREVLTFKWKINGIPKEPPISESDLFSGLYSLKPGDCILFGTYPQTTEGTDNTPVEWRVLDVQDGKALIISDCGLDVQPYNTEYAPVTWETCTLRKWLNDDFLNKAFSESEQQAILTAKVDNSRSQHDSRFSDTYQDYPDTEDKVFLLSCIENDRYFEDDNDALARVTEYAIQQGAFVYGILKTKYGEDATPWRMRSPGKNSCRSMTRGGDGSSDFQDVNVSRAAIRPALWLDLSYFKQ